MNKREEREKINFALGKAIRRRREVLGLYQITVAEHVGLTKQGYSAIERAGVWISVAYLTQIAEALKTSVTSLIFEAEVLNESNGEKVDG